MKKERKETAQDLLMDSISITLYKLDDLDVNEQEKELLKQEIIKQGDRIAKLFKYEKAYWS